jgi:hypothetical protein
LNDPGIVHWEAAIHTLRYLKGSKDFGITIKRTEKDKMNFFAYVDASWANCEMTGRSTTGYLVLWNDNLISWQSKKQTPTSLSLTEAKYVAMSDLVKELLWLRMIVSTSLDLKIPEKLPIFEDNQATIQLANKESNHLSFKTKHMNLWFQFIRSEIIAEQVVVI